MFLTEICPFMVKASHSHALAKSTLGGNGEIISVT